MSAQLAGASAIFTYAGTASVTLSCSTPEELKSALAIFGVGAAANDAKAAATPAPAPAAAGNASASTGTPAGAQAASAGSEASGDEGASPITYKEIAEKVTTMVKHPKIGRDATLALLAKFKGINGQPIDHGNKLQLPDYPAFIAAADAELAKVAK